MGTTVKRTLPYPENYDLVSGGAAAIKALADKLEAEWGAWHYIGAAGEPAFLNGWVNFGGIYQTARFRKEGDRVFVEGLIKSGAQAACFTLPAGYRPPAQLILATQAAAAFAQINVEADGDVLVSGSNASFSVHFSFSTAAV